MYCVEDPLMSVDGWDALEDVTYPVIVPAVIAMRTSCEAGGAFWCGFQSEGTNQAANCVLVVQTGLKTSLFKYGRFLIPTTSYGWGVVDVSRPKAINIGTLPESH